MNIVRAGVDSLYLAIKAKLPASILEELAKAKSQAAQDCRDAAIEFGDSGIRATVPATGQHGGYPFVFDSGPLGARFACREATAGSPWNLFVKPHATAFLGLGFQGVVRMVLEVVTRIGGTVIEISLNRIDYAIDVRADSFVLDPYRFVTHPRATRSGRWSKKDEHQPVVVFRGQSRISDHRQNARQANYTV
jgi:hypothetical protein